MQLRKILIVDDDAEDRFIIKDAIDQIDAHVQIQFAENGEHGLSVLEKITPDAIPQLIVLDLNMPKMNGTQMLKKLKADKRFNNIPVVIYSTSINPLEKEKCMHLGAQAYIIKPVSMQDSLDTARVFLKMCDVKAITASQTQQQPHRS